MRVLIELEGVLADLQPAYWWAYGQAVAEIQTARTDPATFWRVLRTAAPLSQLVRHANPRQLQTFERRLPELLEADEAIECYRAHADVREQVITLGRAPDRVLVTLGSNRGARQRWLDRCGLTDCFAEMHAIAQQPSNRAAQLLKLTAGAPSTVLCGSEGLTRAADAVGLTVIGVAGGVCTPRRLTQAGAGRVCLDLAEFTDPG